MVDAFTPTEWNNNAPPAITAAELDKLGSQAAWAKDYTDEQIAAVPGQVAEIQDEAVAAMVDDTGSATRGALDAAYAPKRTKFGSRLVCDGDSITIGTVTTSSGQQDRGASWVNALWLLSEGRIDYVHNSAVSGDTLATRLADFEDDVLPWDPDVVILTAGTNIGGASAAQYAADLVAYKAKCDLAGIQLVIGEIPPKATDQVEIAARRIEGRRFAAQNDVPLIPFGELLNPATGGWPTGWSSDGTHPDPLNLEALWAMGALAWDVLEDYFPTVVTPTPLLDASDLFADSFLAAMTTAMAATISSVGLASTTGTLATGTYEYRVATGGYLGPSTHYADNSIAVTGPGGVTVTPVASGTHQRRWIFRKGPGDTAFKFLGTMATSGAFTDDGSITPQWEWSGIDFTVVPAPGGLTLSLGDTNPRKCPSRIVFQDPDVLGNAFRVYPGINGTAGLVRFEITGLVPDQVIDWSCKVRGAPTSGGRMQPYLRYRSSGSGIADLGMVKMAMDGEWHRLYFRSTVPSGADRVRMSFEMTAPQEWVDFAEILYDVVA